MWNWRNFIHETERAARSTRSTRKTSSYVIWRDDVALGRVVHKQDRLIDKRAKTIAYRYYVSRTLGWHIGKSLYHSARAACVHATMWHMIASRINLTLIFSRMHFEKWRINFYTDEISFFIFTNRSGLTSNFCENQQNLFSRGKSERGHRFHGLNSLNRFNTSPVTLIDSLIDSNY